MPVEVRSDIPIPSGSSRRREPNSPWTSMEVGDSFFMRHVKSAESGVYYRNHQEGGKRYTFEPRTEDVDGKPVNGARVWRVA